MMRKQLFKTLGILSISAFLTWGCSSAGTAHDYTVNDLQFELAGPLFEGPNQGQYVLEIDLATALGDAYEEGMSVSDARLKSATVLAGDSLGFSQVRSFVLSFASDNAEVAMQEAAFKNPLPDGATEVALEVAPDAELGAIVAEGTLYLVLDADLAEDYYDGNRNFKLNLSLELTVKS
ncbi:MAG: hypothetical protein ACO3PE_05615 [Schleiferiaceae bacterium]